MRNIKGICILITMLSSLIGYGQPEEFTLTLDGACRLAKSNSLSVFINKNNFLSSYWEYRTYKADFLPELSLKSNLISYKNANNLRYNSVTKSESYVHTQNLNSDVSLSIRQNVGLTGGSIFLESSLDRNQNLGDQEYIQYASRPYRIGYSQKLFGYNRLKWSRLLEPKKYEKAKREYLSNLENVYITTCNYFFNYALAEKNRGNAKYNYDQTNTMVQIAHKRFKIGTIEKDELLQLELQLNNQSIALKEWEVRVRKSKVQFLSFLRLPQDTEVKVLLPSVDSIRIEESDALTQARRSNVLMIQNELTLLNDQSNVARVKSEHRFQANLNLSYGINKVDGSYDYKSKVPLNGSIPNVYQPKFDDYQDFGVSLKIPLLDWGRRRGRVEMAKSRQEVNRIKVEQSQIDFEQNVLTTVMEFNLQYDKVKASQRSQELAEDGYEVTTKRFRNGNIDVLQLNSAQRDRSSAMIKVIQSKYNYWKSYFTVRKLTLYDFKSDVELSEDFDELVKNL
ncbi:TolC family protein [Halosquirtibacter xylanolyticus]|uniref:TolC family protein n=1 Tax=Halosquirtibacter xylanolyticus TaxID=3374599 RepID=UPI00374A7555|nr:TolC family protein [Prolixibacteraceae bacterium]